MDKLVGFGLIRVVSLLCTCSFKYDEMCDIPLFQGKIESATFYYLYLISILLIISFIFTHIESSGFLKVLIY